MIGGEQAIYCPSVNDSANDLSGNGRNGTYVGGMGTVSDVGAGGTVAYLFDGINDKVSLPASVLPTGYPFSMSGWAKTAGNNLAVCCFGNSGSDTQVGMMQSQDNDPCRSQIRNTTAAQNAVTTASSVDGVWHHVVSVFVSNTLRRCYINGGNVGTNTVNIAFPSFDGASLGSLFRQNEIFYPGRADDIRIFHRELTAGDISTLYNGGNGRGVGLAPPSGDEYLMMDPTILKAGLSDGTNLKRDLTTASYTGGVPSSGQDLKATWMNPNNRDLLRACVKNWDGKLKPSLKK